MGKPNKSVADSYFLDAESIGKKTIDARGLTTDERLAIASHINRRAFFSAGVMDENLLDKMREFIDDSLRKGEFDKDKFVNNMQDFLSKYDLSIDGGGLDELKSDSRLRLIYETQLKMAEGEAFYDMFKDAETAEEFPCMELVRVEPRKEPRDWISIWAENGGEFFGTSGKRMIATREDPIWLSISDFGNPYPPFKYNSGMGVKPISKRNAVKLGVVSKYFVGQPNPNLDGEEF